MNLDWLLSEVKKKKELSRIDDSLVLKISKERIKNLNIPLESLSGKELKILVKDIRSELRDYVGRFQIGEKDRQKLLEKGDLFSLLNTHSSTKERIEFYPKLKEILSILGIKSILDLGCGLNPLTLSSKEITYYASDINLADLEIVEKFFLKNKINGKVFVCDLKNPENCAFPKTDIALIFKVFDILGKNDYLTAEKVINLISSKYILASFSTRTLSGKKMSSPRRIWFEKLLKNLGYSFKTLSSNNEIFYIASSSSQELPSLQ